MKPHKDILMCTREASRAAHRQRDYAQTAYLSRRHLDASDHRRRKENWYSLKERGIVHLHRNNLIRYIGTSPQGMAVYEYGEGGMSCLHSRLHPIDSPRTPIEGHPETLLVPSKGKQRGISEERIEVTLESLSSEITGYEKSEAPQFQREQSLPTCWTCGEEGHISRFCPEGPDSFDDDDDDEWDIRDYCF